MKKPTIRRISGIGFGLKNEDCAGCGCSVIVSKKQQDCCGCGGGS